YTIMRLPGEKKEEFILLTLYNPSRRDNMIAWLAARSDPPNYGKLIVFNFPKQKLVYGPRQIDARIDQDPIISQQLALWNQRGSTVIRGSLLAIPIDQSLIYVQPLYLAASEQGALPELRRVIVAYGNQIAMEATLEQSLERLRRVSSRLTVTQAKPETADYTTADVLYAVTLPRDLRRAPNLSWVQVHMAGVNGLYDHPIYSNSAIALTTASGVHAATVAEYAMTTLLALAHRVPRMVEWQGKGVWPPDEQRWPLFVPTPVRGATLGVIGYGSIGRELARIAKTAFAMTVLACKRDPKRRADPGYCPPGTGDAAGALPDEWFSPERLDALLA